MKLKVIGPNVLGLKVRGIPTKVVFFNKRRIPKAWRVFVERSPIIR